MRLARTSACDALLGRRGLGIRPVPEHEVGEEGVALAHPEIVQQRLRHVAGVLEEAGEASEHLDDLQRGEVVRLLHVLNARGQAFLFCGGVDK